MSSHIEAFFRGEEHFSPGKKKLIEKIIFRPGDHGGGATPDSIPNSEVKTSSANDTASPLAGK